MNKNYIEAYGVKGNSSTPWRKIFSSPHALAQWAERNNAEIHGTRRIQPQTPTLLTLPQIQGSLDAQFGVGMLNILSRRKDGTVNIKGMFDQRILVRTFLKKAGIVCLNKIAEQRGYTATIKVA